MTYKIGYKEPLNKIKAFIQEVKPNGLIEKATLVASFGLGLFSIPVGLSATAGYLAIKVFTPYSSSPSSASTTTSTKTSENSVKSLEIDTSLKESSSKKLSSPLSPARPVEPPQLERAAPPSAPQPTSPEEAKFYLTFFNAMLPIQERVKNWKVCAKFLFEEFEKLKAYRASPVEAVSKRIRPGNSSPFQSAVTLLLQADGTKSLFINNKKSVMGRGGFKQAKTAFRLQLDPKKPTCEKVIRLVGTRRLDFLEGATPHISELETEVSNTKLFRPDGALPIWHHAHFLSKSLLFSKYEIFQPLGEPLSFGLLREIDEDTKLQIAIDLLKMLSQIAIKGTHGDIKKENVILLFDALLKRKTAHIIDLGGFAAYGTLPEIETQAYSSPEVATAFKNKGPASDVWAMGLALLQIFFQKQPFYFGDNAPLETIKGLEDGWADEYLVHENPEINSILRDMLKTKPKERITAAEALNRFQNLQAPLLIEEPIPNKAPLFSIAEESLDELESLEKVKRWAWNFFSIVIPIIGLIRLIYWYLERSKNVRQLSVSSLDRSSLSRSISF